jgi:hypothetical protein
VVTSNATATAGTGPGGGNTALATAIGSGTGGVVTAKATTVLASIVHPSTIIASASANVSGTVSVTAETLGTTALSFITPAQGLAYGTVAPDAASTTPVIATNPNIAGAIGAGSPFLAMGELGGGYTAGATGARTYTSSLELKVALNSADLAQDLLVGLYGGTSLGAGVTGVSLDIKANGVALQTNTFASGTAAASFFTDHSINLGSLSGSAFAGGALDLLVTMRVTATSAGSGFYGGLIVTG